MSNTDNKTPDKQNQTGDSELNVKKNSKKKLKKRIRKILKIFAWFAAVILALMILLLCLRDSIIKSCITGIGSWLISSEIKLEKFETSLLDGEVKMINLQIANPQGYAMPHLLNMESFYLKLNPASLFTDSINIENIDVSGLTVVGEFDKNGKFNATELVQNIKNKFPGSANAKSDSSGDPAGPPADEAKKTVQIGNILLNDSNAVITDDRVEIPVQIPLYFSSSSLSLDITDGNLLERLEYLAGQMQYSCTGVANAGELVIDTGKQIINNTGDAGKKLLDNTGSTGKQILNKATDLFNIKNIIK